jgi:hypothetical protein
MASTMCGGVSVSIVGGVSGRDIVRRRSAAAAASSRMRASPRSTGVGGAVAGRKLSMVSASAAGSSVAPSTSLAAAASLTGGGAWRLGASGVLGGGVGVGGIYSGSSTTATRLCRLVKASASNGADGLPNDQQSVDALERQAQGSSNSNTGTSTPPPTSGGSPPARRRGPPNPFYRTFLKLKLYCLYALGWAYTTAKSLFFNKWFVVVFTVFVAASTALGVKGVAAARAGARPAATPTVLYSHFTKDLAAKKVRAVRFEEGTTRILYELKDGAVGGCTS